MTSPSSSAQPFSGVPAWLQEVLPPWCRRHPIITEAAYATMKSFAFGSSILIVAAAQEGAFATPHSTAVWFATNWWGLLTAGAIAALRGKEAHGKAAIAAGPTFGQEQTPGS